MGSSVKAVCKCGYEGSFAIGGGMISFETVCEFPCLCKKCNQIVECNLLNKRVACPECKSTRVVPYDDKQLCGKPGTVVVTSWNMEKRLGRELELTNGTYFCPKCQKFDLEFQDEGICWD